MALSERIDRNGLAFGCMMRFPRVLRDKMFWGRDLCLRLWYAELSRPPIYMFLALFLLGIVKKFFLYQFRFLSMRRSRLGELVRRG
jgi:hypothetical protein